MTTAMEAINIWILAAIGVLVMFVAYKAGQILRTIKDQKGEAKEHDDRN